MELRDHCHRRANYHRDRADAKEAELPKLRASLSVVNAAPTPEFANSVSRIDATRAVEHVQAEINNHRAMARRFDFFALHLFAPAVYSLTRCDLDSLEMLP